MRITAGAVELVKVIDHPYEWDYSGTTGVFVSPERVLFVTLSTAGIRRVSVDIGVRQGGNVPVPIHELAGELRQ